MSEETAYQSQPETVTETPIESTPVAQEAPATTQEAPKGLTVKYNKEDKFVPEDELPSYVQKGLNYDKVSERAQQAESYQKNLERIAKFYGYDSHDAYMTALDQAERQQEIQAEAERLGVDASVVEKFREEINPLKQEVEQFKQEKAALEQEKYNIRIAGEINELKGKYPDFEQHQEQIFDLAMKGYQLEHAYKLATYDSKINTIAKQTEAETLRKVQQNGATSPGSLSTENVQHQKGFATLSKERQREMINEVVQGRRRSLDE